MTVEDVEVRNFCNGIYFENVDYSKISECCVHDNGNASATDGNKLNTNGIMLQNADHCNVSKNNIYNNTGKTQGGCGDGGSGIRLQGESDYNNITCNNITGNYLAGVFSKYWCQYNYIAYNYVHGNGHDVDPDPAWVGGGIRGECKNSNHWDIEYNNVTANYGPGIFMRGHGNDIRYNTMRDNVNATDNPAAVDPWAPEDWGAGTGIVSHRGTAGADNTVYNNSACNNEYYDIRDNNAHLNGDNNTCDTCSNYNDEGKICCSYDCPGEVGCVAVDGTVFGCGDTVTKSCTFNENISCAAGHGLIIVAGNITIDGNGYIIDGVSPGACDLWGGQIQSSGIYVKSKINVTIKNLEVRNFCNGIYFGYTYGNNIYNCTVHDNGNKSAPFSDEVNTNGIIFMTAIHSNVSKNSIYNNTGNLNK